ncbi:MAG: hypothetical protein Q9164_004978 [Protoblastenia rupestris]
MINDEKPFTARRVLMPVSSTVVAPQVVRCVWERINVANLSSRAITHEEMDSVKGCILHNHCKGHLRTSRDGDAYLIPCGFATAGELRESDFHMFNRMVVDGRKSSEDLMNFCFDKVSGKNGIMGKMCNGCRPTDTYRFVASPSKMHMSTIYMPPTVFEKGLFLYTKPDGRCTTRRLREGDAVVLGRCPSQVADSTLGLIVAKGTENETSVRVPLEVCEKTNGDFDGDKMYVLVPSSRFGIEEAQRVVKKIWQTALERVVPVTNYGDEIDPAMYTTVTFEEMSTHKGGVAYDLMKLKTNVSQQGFVNTMMGRHGIAGPYGVMRLGMMLGTSVYTDSSSFVIHSAMAPSIPLVKKPFGSHRVMCSSAIAKLTKTIYQRGIDISKHGSSDSVPPAMEMFMKDMDDAYAIVQTNSCITLSRCSASTDDSVATMRTNLTSVSRSGTHETLLKNAIVITSMIEERLAFAIFMCYICSSPVPLLDSDPVTLMYGLGLDWCTSFTCSNIKWFKSVLRDPQRHPHARINTDINPTLGAIFIGNINMISLSAMLT